MLVLNAHQSSEYYDSLVDDREDSAVTVIHGAWLEHSSSLRRLEPLEPTAPLDMLILYQAAAATFKDWTTRPLQQEELMRGGRVVNWEQAHERLKTLPDAELANLATRFANQVVALSRQAAAEQDLHYFVELFLHAVEDKRVIEGIVQGTISSRTKTLSDPDLW